MTPSSGGREPLQPRKGMPKAENDADPEPVAKRPRLSPPVEGCSPSKLLQQPPPRQLLMAGLCRWAKGTVKLIRMFNFMVSPQTSSVRSRWC